MGTRFTDILPDNYGYFIGVVSEATGPDIDAVRVKLAPAALEVIGGGLRKLPSLLDERGLSITTYDAVQFSYDWCQFACQTLSTLSSA